jgi:DNA-binding response OmpR family regulator
MDEESAGMCIDLGDRAASPELPAEAPARIADERDDQARQPGGGWSDQVIKVGNLSLHVGRLEADLGRGRVPLTRLEFLLLQELMRHAGQSVSKGQLLASVWGYETDPGSNVVGVCVRRLRTKLGDHLIKTIRGEGYQLAVG